MQTFDFVILGGGATAFAAAIKANQLGKKTAMINDGLPLGGTCVNVGCVPSKTLIHAAGLLHHSKHHGVPGINLKIEKFSFSEVIADELALVKTMRSEKYVSILKHLDNVTLFEGKGAFINPHTIEVNGEQVRGEKILIATGSTAHGLPITGLEEAGYLTHIEALKLKQQPKRLAVIGAGPLGLEFAQMFSRFGTEVTLLQRNEHVMPSAEKELTARLKEILAAEGIKVFTGAQTNEIRSTPKGKEVVFEVDGNETIVIVDEILVAAGKTPNTIGIGLEKTGVQINDRKSVIVTNQYKTNIDHIFSAGDAASLPLRMETTAGKEGTYAAENALMGTQKTIHYDTVPWTVFTDPELAGVGLTDAQVVERGLSCKCKTVSFEMVPKAHIIRETRGLIKLIADNKTREVLGVHILAPNAGDLIAQAMVVVKNKMTVDDLIDSVPMFPTLSESLKIAALAFDQDLKTLSCCT